MSVSAFSSPGRTIGHLAGRSSDPRHVTAPLSIVTNEHLRIEASKGCLVAAIDGGLDVELGEQIIAELLDESDGTAGIVLDLDDATLLERDGIDTLLRGLGETTPAVEVCLSASRLSARMVLARWGITGTHAVFASVADALQAKLMADDSYGEGWTVL